MGRITSPDPFAPGGGATWSELEIVLEQDPEELAMARPRGPAAMSARDDPRPDVDIYTSCAIKYPWAAEVYLAFPSFYYHW
jgi:hypothetical protein